MGRLLTANGIAYAQATALGGGYTNMIIVMEAMKSNGYAIDLLPMYLQARSDIQEASRKNIEAIHQKFGRQDTVVEFGDKVRG